MMTFNQAKQIGLQACIEALGRDIVEAHADKVSYAYAKHDDVVFCLVCVNTEPMRPFDGTLKLTNEPKPRYRVSCDVSMQDGEVYFIETLIPDKEVL